MVKLCDILSNIAWRDIQSRSWLRRFLSGWIPMWDSFAQRIVAKRRGVDSKEKTNTIFKQHRARNSWKMIIEKVAPGNPLDRAFAVPKSRRNQKRFSKK